MNLNAKKRNLGLLAHNIAILNQISASVMEYQDEKKIVGCALCFEPCETNCKGIDDSASKMMALLLLQCDLQNDGQSMMCNKCADNLKVCFEFKSSCLSLKNHIASDKGNTKLDLSFPPGNSCSLPEFATICCLCMKSATTYDLFTSSIANKIDISLTALLNTYFPELSPNTAQDLSVCASCKVALKTFFKTMNNWSDIRRNVERNTGLTDLSSNNPIDLNLISQFELKRECDDKNFEVDNILSGNQGSRTKFNEHSLIHSPLSPHEQEFIVTPEEIHLKMEQDSDKRLEEDTVNSCQYEGTETNGNVLSHCGDHLNQLNSPTNSTVTEVTKHQGNVFDSKARAKGQLNRRITTNMHPSEATMYRCEKCEYKTKCEFNLRRHRVTHQDFSDVTVYQCEKCEFKTKHKESIKRHVISHQDPSEVVIYQCPECEYKAKSKSLLTRHMVNHQAESEITFYQCTKCDYKAKQKGHLKTHMMTHQDPSEITMYECEYKRKNGKCEYKTKYKSDLKKHMTYQHPSEITVHQCDKCDYRTTYKSDLRRHVVSHMISSEVTMYQCDKCEHKSKRRSNLKVHMMTHQDPSAITMYKCSKCEYRTKNMYSLNRHDKIVHQTYSNTSVRQRKKRDYKAKDKSYLKSHISHQK